MHYPDIDIDSGNRDKILELITYIPAELSKDKKHNSGVHIQPIPVNPATNLSALNYKEADTRGYYKLDLLNVNLYNRIKDKEHYEKLLAMEPPWHRLCEKEFVSNIIHIGNYYRLLTQMKPNTIPRIAMFLAIMRPGKKHLQNKSWKEVGATVWDVTGEGYIYRKSHAISYAVLVGLNMLLNDTTSV